MSSSADRSTPDLCKKSRTRPAEWKRCDEPHLIHVPVGSRSVSARLRRGYLQIAGTVFSKPHAEQFLGVGYLAVRLNCATEKK